MKRFNRLSFYFSILLINMAFPVINAQNVNKSEEILKSAMHLYKDGDYVGLSRARYTEEPFWGITRIEIRNGAYSRVMFMIRDSSLHETFGKKYAVHFKDNPVYIEQCRKDSKGAKKYPKRLFKTQDIDQVDAMSGATWSYNIFRASVKEALKNAYNSPDSLPSH